MNRTFKIALKAVIVIALMVILAKQIMTYDHLTKLESLYTGETFENSMLGGWLEHLTQRITKYLNV